MQHARSICTAEAFPVHAFRANASTSAAAASSNAGGTDSGSSRRNLGIGQYGTVSPGVGKTTLARLVAAALGRACAWVACGTLGGAAALHGVRSGSPGRIVEELRRVGVRNPVFVLDEIDCLDEAGGAASALLEALDPAPGTTFRDRYLDLPFDLSGALFVATATGTGSVPPMLRERMRVIELPGYTEAEKRVIATRRLLPLQLAFHGLTADQVHVTDEAVEAVIRGYTREAGVWELAGTLGAVCAKVVWKWQPENGPLWPRENGPPDEVGRGESEPAAHRETSPRQLR